VEDVFIATMSTDEIKQHLHELTKAPHVAGTAADHANALYVRDKYVVHNLSTRTSAHTADWFVTQIPIVRPYGRARGNGSRVDEHAGAEGGRDSVSRLPSLPGFSHRTGLPPPPPPLVAV
jgi:hypothetical protein